MTDTLYLIAHIARRAVAIGSSQVESVVDIGAVTPAPRAPDHIRGLAALRSRVMTVVDAHAALGMPRLAIAGSRAIVTVVDGHHYAVLVDALEDIAPFVPRPLAPGVTLGDGWRAVGCGEVERDGEPILAIDLAALVRGGAADPALN